MNRYVVYFTGHAYIDAENAVQAANQAKKYKLIGQAIGSRRTAKERDATRYERGKATLTVSNPIRVNRSDAASQPSTTKEK